MSMFDALRFGINDALQQRLGVDVPTGQGIIFANGSTAILRSEGPFGGVLQFVTPGTFPVSVEENKAMGATRIGITVFEDREYKYPDGTRVTRPKTKAKYPIR